MTIPKEDERTPGLPLRVSEKFPTNVKDNVGTVIAQCWPDGARTAEEWAKFIVEVVNAYTSTETLRSALHILRTLKTRGYTKATAKLLGPEAEAHAWSSTELAKWADDLADAALSGTSTDGLREAFRHADNQDWDYLFAKLNDAEPHDQRPRFWISVLKAARTALAGVTAPADGETR